MEDDESRGGDPLFNQGEPEVVDLGRPPKCLPASQLPETRHYMVEKSIVPMFRRQIQRIMIERYLRDIQEELDKADPKD